MRTLPYVRCWANVLLEPYAQIMFVVVELLMGHLVCAMGRNTVNTVVVVWE